MPIRKMSATEDTKSPDGSSHKLAGGGSMSIHKMLATEENKPDGSSHKPAGGGIIPICKMSATEDNKPPDGSGGGGTESIPQKPALHHQLTGLFSLTSQISADKENPRDGSQIHKSAEAQSENPEKPAKGVGMSKETEPKLPITPQKGLATDGEGKGDSHCELPICEIEDSDISKVETVEKRDEEKEETGISDGNKEDNNTESRDSDGTVDINDRHRQGFI